MPADLAIDYLSPLPPVRSGIADYSIDLLPNLEPWCDLRVLRLPGQPVSPAVIERWNPRAAEHTGEEGRLPLYQMGNNEYHAPVMEMAQERPGIVALHDVVLHHLLVEMTLGRSDLDTYLERLAADHGWVGETAAAARRWGELGQAAMFSLPAHRTLLRRQRGVLVHSRWAAERILEDDSEIEVRQIPMGIPLPAAADAGKGRALRQRFDISPEAPVIGSLGFQTPIKRTERVIAAMARPGMGKVHLLIVGEVSKVLDYDAVAAEIGVADRVHVTGFLDYAAFEAAIAACDLCVNLRYPTAGETSASLLRVLAVGRPAIVSDYAHAAELPDDVVVKIPLGEDEVGQLATRVGALLADRGRLAAMSIAARRYIAEQHDPQRAGKAVADACRDLAGVDPPGDLELALPSPSTLVWRRLGGELCVEGADTPWPEGEARTLGLHLVNRGPARWLATGAGTGGVMTKIEWRSSPWDPPDEPQWLGLPADLEPGRSRDLEIRLRRPVGASMLVVEPHVRGVSGMNALGGPRWVRFY